jgi:peptidoglycan hydrolase-like protein with peptidoglycan-binding domain
VNRISAGAGWRARTHQSTRAKFSHVFEETPGERRFGYKDFDREVFGVAKAENYDPSRAAKPNLTSPRFMRADGKPDPTIDRVFRGRATLRAGSPPGAVKMLQQALVDLKKYDLGDFGPANDGVDGKYGSETSRAVKQFKTDENLGSESEGTQDAASSSGSTRCSRRSGQAGAHARSQRSVLPFEARPTHVTGSGDDARSLDDLRPRELLARQIELGSTRQAVPVVDALPRAVGVLDLGDQQRTAEEVLHHQRGHPALAPRAVRRRPVGKVHRIARLR